MPVEYIYKITIDDSDLQQTLKSIDTSLSSLANRTAASFDKVGTSMGTGVKKAAAEAKKAVSDVEKAQKTAATTATKTEKAYVRLLAAELKLAAGGDKLTQEFIKNAAAGAQSAETLANLVLASTSLTDAQVSEALAVSTLNGKIQELSAAMAQEGADTAALTQEIVGYQAQLDSIAATKEAERAATEASAQAKREEAEATAQASAAMAAAQAESAATAERTEKSYIKLLSAELKLAAGSDEAAQAFIKQAAAGAQSADALGMLVAKSTSLTQTQVQQAQTVAFLKNQIQTLTAAMAEEGADTEALTGRISEYQSMLERIINTREAERAAAAASTAAKKAEADAVAQATSEVSKAQAETTAEIDKAEAAYKKLLVAQLKLAAGSDKAAKDMIDSVSAGAQNAEVLLQAVSATNMLSEAQIDAANNITYLRNAITETSAAMKEEGADTDELAGRLDFLTSILNNEVEARDRAIQAAKNQAQAEQEAGDAVDDAAGKIDDSLDDVSEGAERNEQAFIKLLAAQLKLAAGADQSAQALIKNSAATAQTGDALLSAVSQTENLSEAQIEHAVRVATLEETIQSLTAELSQEGASVEDLEGKIRAANVELEAMAEAQEAAAAAAQNQRAMADEAIAAITANKASMAEANKAQAKQEKLNAIAQRKANREFTKLAKSFPEIKQALVELTGEYGTFKSVIGDTGQATGRAQEDLHQLFKDNPKFARELEILTTRYGKFTATIQRADFGPRMKSTGQQVRQLGFALQRMGIGGVAAFGEIFAALGPLGIAIGAIIVPVIALTKAIKKMADEAVKMFKKVTKEAFEAAKEFETTEAAFKAIFKAADTSGVVEASLRRVRQESERLGVTLEEILPKILPKVSTLEQAFEIAELIPGLAASAIDLGPQDALRSVIEGLAGDLVSLRKAFEIDVTGIRVAQEEFGLVQGLIIGLNAELEAMGLTFADQAETINVKIGQLQQRWQTFKQLMGEPLVDAMKEQFESFFNLLDKEETKLDNLAVMIGEIVAQLGTRIGEGLFDALNEIDPKDIERIANSLGRIASEFLVHVEGIVASFEGIEGIAGALETVAEKIEHLSNAITLITKLHNAVKAITQPFNMFKNILTDTIGKIKLGDDTIGEIIRVIWDLNAAMDSVIMIIGLFQTSLAFALGGVVGFLSGIDDLILGTKSLEDVINDAFTEALSSAKEAMESANREMRSFQEVTLDSVDAVDDLGEEALLAANEILTMNLALKNLTKSEDGFLEKQEEINDAIADFARDASTKFQDILTDLGRDMLDAQIANQRKLVDILTKNLQELDDIRRGHDNDVIAASLSLSDREADILRKHGREMGEIESDLNKERLKIEQNYLDDLERMRAKFQFDMFEAMLANDAKRLAQLRRRQAFEEKEAVKDRDRDLRDAGDKADEERQARKLTLEQELQDARISNARVIRDLLLGMEEQFREQEISRLREVEAQALANKRKEEDMQSSFNRQLDDYDIWWIEQHRRTTEGIMDDLEQMQQWVTDRNEILAEIQNIAQVASEIPLEQLREMTAHRLTELANQNLQQAQIGQVLPPGTETQSLQDLTGMSSIDLFASTLANKTREELETMFDAASMQLALPNLLQQQAIELQNQQIEGLGLQPTPGGTSGQVAFVMGLTEAELQTYITELVAEMAGIELPEAMPAGMLPGLAPAGAGAGAGLPPLSEADYVRHRLSDLLNFEVTAQGVELTDAMRQSNLEFSRNLNTSELIAAIAALEEQLGLQPTFYFPPEYYEPGYTLSEEKSQQAIPEGFSYPIVPQAQQSATGAGVYGATGAYAPTGQPAQGYGFPPTLPADLAQMENLFLPGNLMPIPPTYGFDADAYFDSLDDETEAAAQAELYKRGEIADTVDIAALLAEQRALLHKTYMQDEVVQTRIASDSQIEILEKTLASQREVLKAVRTDPTLQVDVDAIETSIGVLEDLIARAREQQVLLAEQTAQQEATALTGAEEIKREEIEETTETAEDAWLRRKMAADTGLHGEIVASQEAKKEQVDLVDERLQEQGEMTSDFRTQEYELQTEADEELRELFADSGDDLLDMQYGWWRNLLDAQTQGITSDLHLMIRWLEERQRIWEQLELTMPGEGTLPLSGDPDTTATTSTGDDDDPTGTIGATIEQLQALALGYAQQLGYEMGVWRDHIYSLSYDDLLALTFELQDLVSAAGYALGGGFLPGKKLLVGEAGPEIVSFDQAGVIKPLSAFMERPPSGLAGIGETSIDNSINMHNDFPDPRGLSPSVIATMENISAKIALKVWSDRKIR